MNHARRHIFLDAQGSRWNKHCLLRYEYPLKMAFEVIKSIYIYMWDKVCRGHRLTLNTHKGINTKLWRHHKHKVVSLHHRASISDHHSWKVFWPSKTFPMFDNPHILQTSILWSFPLQKPNPPWKEHHLKMLKKSKIMRQSSC